MNFTVGIVSRNLANMSNSSNSETVGIDTFFEVSCIGCRKTTCDVTKVTYNMYLGYLCCISREMMEMEGRDSAKCRKSKN